MKSRVVSLSFVLIRTQDCETSCLMLTVARAVFDLPIPSKPLVAGEYKVQPRPSPHWLLCHLSEEVVTNAFQKPLGFRTACCVACVANIRVV